jgi:transposase
MTWKPSYLTREQMEERRLEGGRLLKVGKLSQAEIARQLGVSRATVSDWAQIIAAKGMRGLRKRKAAGIQSKLNLSQKQKLKYMLDRGALANGFPTDRWTLGRVQQLIQ